MALLPPGVRILHNNQYKKLPWRQARKKITWTLGYNKNYEHGVPNPPKIAKNRIPKPQGVKMEATSLPHGNCEELERAGGKGCSPWDSPHTRRRSRARRNHWASFCRICRICVARQTPRPSVSHPKVEPKMLHFPNLFHTKSPKLWKWSPKGSPFWRPISAKIVQKMPSGQQYYRMDSEILRNRCRRPPKSVNIKRETHKFYTNPSWEPTKSKIGFQNRNTWRSKMHFVRFFARLLLETSGSPPGPQKSGRRPNKKVSVISFMHFCIWWRICFALQVEFTANVIAIVPTLNSTCRALGRWRFAHNTRRLLEEVVWGCGGPTPQASSINQSTIHGRCLMAHGS